MSCRSHCRAVKSLFDAKNARKELDRYRRRGPDRTTRILSTLIRRAGIRGATLLDIGGGIGVISHEPLDVRSATHVDAASASLEVASKEAQRLGHAELIDFVHGDFVELAERTDVADLVTLDRVICCYPAMPRLIVASAAKARLAYAFSVPRDRWYIRAMPALENLFWRLTGSDFRIFVHPIATLDRMLADRGLYRRFYHDSLAWHVGLYVRDAAAATAATLAPM